MNVEALDQKGLEAILAFLVYLDKKVTEDSAAQMELQVFQDQLVHQVNEDRLGNRGLMVLQALRVHKVYQGYQA